MVVNGHSQSADRCIDTRIHPAAPPTRCEWPLTTNSATVQSALIGNVDSTDSKQRLTTNNSDTQSASSQPTTLLSVVSGDSQPADRRHAMCAYCVIILVLTASNHSQSIRKQAHCTPEYRRRQLNLPPSAANTAFIAYDSQQKTTSHPADRSIDPSTEAIPSCCAAALACRASRDARRRSVIG